MSVKSKHKNTPDLLALRRARGLSQAEFWGKLGSTQSSGSRFEQGRGLPSPVALLIDLVYVRSIDIAKVNGQDMLIVAHLQASHPDLYARLLRIVQGIANKTGKSMQKQRVRP